MYTTAKLILDELESKRLLKREFEKPEFKDYQLILTGHSLGAGVVSVLSIILKKDYPNLKCYAFSPPGCILRSVHGIKQFIFEHDVIPDAFSVSYVPMSLVHYLDKLAFLCCCSAVFRLLSIREALPLQLCWETT